jgi:hypothetical protein
MVAIYFDKEFLRLLSDRNDHAGPVIYDFLNQFIKKIRGVKVFINLDSLEELNEAILHNEYYYFISEISSPLLLNFKARLSDSTFFEEGSITKLFFVENCNETELQEKYNYHFISNNTLIEKWKLFLSDREDSELVIKSNPDQSKKGVFHSWEDLNLFAHKINNIIVFDLYVLVNKKDQKINKNVLPCLKELIKGSKDKVKELTIFTKDLADNSAKKREVQGIWQVDDLKNTFDYLEPLYKQIKDISFVKYDETKNAKTDSEHNRFILTNYFYIRLEAGINIFKENGKVNNRDAIKFDSILKNRTRNIVIEILNNLKMYSSHLKQKDTKAIGPGQLLEHYYFYPSLKCGFLS